MARLLQEDPHFKHLLVVTFINLCRLTGPALVEFCPHCWSAIRTPLKAECVEKGKNVEDFKGWWQQCPSGENKAMPPLGTWRQNSKKLFVRRGKMCGEEG